MNLIPSEKQIIKAVLEYLAYKGIFCWRNNSGCFFFKDVRTGRTRMFKSGIKGMADIIGIVKGGIFLAIECKAKKGKLSLEQKNFINKIKQYGGIAFVAKSVEDVEREFKNII